MGYVQTVVGYGFRYNHKSARRNNFHDTRRYRTIFFFDQDGKFRKKRVSLIESLYFRFIKGISRMVVCKKCKRKYALKVRKSLNGTFVCSECRL